MTYFNDPSFLKILDDHQHMIEVILKISHQKHQKHHSRHSFIPKQQSEIGKDAPALRKEDQNKKSKTFSSLFTSSKNSDEKKVTPLLDRYSETFLQKLSNAKISELNYRTAPESPKVPPVLFKVSSCFIQKLSNQYKGAKIVVNQSNAPTRRVSILPIPSQEVYEITSHKKKSLDMMTSKLLVNNRLSFASVPKGMSLPDFLIVTVVEFSERVELIHSCCSVFCTAETCPLFNVGSKYQFLWVDKDIQKPIQVSAPEYFDYFKRWMKRQLSNEKLFPLASTTSLSTQASEIIQIIFRRLIRIIGHYYYCHFQSIQNLEIESILNTVLVHYTQVAIMNEMIDYTDLEMLKEVYFKLGVIS